MRVVQITSSLFFFLLQRCVSGLSLRTHIGLADSIDYCIAHHARLVDKMFTSRSRRELREAESCLLSNLTRCLEELQEIERRLDRRAEFDRVTALQWELDTRKRKRRQRLGLPTESQFAKLFQ